MKKTYLLLIIISTALMFGCYESWYPVYDDWLCTINIDGSNLNYIRDSYEKFLLSPDRETLIEYCGNKFYSINLNDLSYRTLLFDFGDDNSAIYQPAMSNTKIVFSHHGEIYTFDLEDCDTTRLTFSASTSNWHPSFSSDGTKIAYTTKSDSLSTIVVMNSDGSNQNVILEQSANNYNRSFRFVINDEVLLYYIRWKTGIYSINIDGSDYHCILEDVSPLYLTLSPNRDYILFSDDGYIHRVNADGLNHVVLGDAGDDYFFPSISPDGKNILFTYADCPYIMNADGSNRYKIIDMHIGNFDPYCKESFLLNNYKILLNLEKQIN